MSSPALPLFLSFLIQVPVLQVNSGPPLVGLGTIACHLVKEAKRPDLLGDSAESRAVVQQWIEHRVTKLDRCRKDDVKTFLKVISILISERRDGTSCIPSLCPPARSFLWVLILIRKKSTRIQAEVWPYSDMASLNSEKRCNMPGEKQPVMDHHARRPLALSCQREVFVCMESQRDTLLWHVWGVTLRGSMLSGQAS